MAGIDSHQTGKTMTGGLVALDPLHLANDPARIDFVRIAPIGLVRLTQHRVEAFGDEICSFDLMPVVGGRLCKRGGGRLSQRVGTHVSRNQQGFHAIELVIVALAGRLYD